MKKLITAEVVGKSFKLGLGEDTSYRIDYIDEQGIKRTTLQYGKDIEEACKKKDINWLS